MDNFFNSTNFKIVTGGRMGDFNWPYNVPDGAFGPWSPLCTSELLNPNMPCRPYINGQPCNFKELTFMFSEILQAIVTLCHDLPPEGNPGDPDWIDPRLLAIDSFLEFKWGNCYNDMSGDLRQGISHYLFVILKEAVLRQNYVYFTKYPELQQTLKVIHDAFDGCSWGLLDERIQKVTNIILLWIKNKSLISYQLEVQITNELDDDWVKINNISFTNKKDYSLTVASNLVKLNLPIFETLKRYCLTENVLQFELTQCKNNVGFSYNLKYGNGKFNVRVNEDFLNVAKAIFGS